MAINEVRFNHIGFMIKNTIKDHNKVVIDLSGASSKLLILESPVGVRKEKIVSYVTDGSDGRFYYTTIDNDFDELGVWEYQLFIIKGGTEYPSNLGSFTVKRNL